VRRTDVGRAVVPAPREAVFAALVDEDARTAWLPPSGMTGRFERYDARPGGGYRMVLTYDDPATPGKTGDGTDVVEARFVTVEPPDRVVEEADFVSDDPDLAGTMTMTWSLEPVPDGTEVTITATDVPSGIAAEDHATAFASTLQNLATYVMSKTASAGRRTTDRQMITDTEE
jgi:uncharacterized protein YndB with AHSA1/START domain